MVNNEQDKDERLMTKIFLLEALKVFTIQHTENMRFPVKMQKEDSNQPPDRPPEVFMMNLIKPSSSIKSVPYIIHQVITGNDKKPKGKREEGETVIRSVCCVYNDDGQEGSLMLLNLMEHLRIALLKQVVIGNQFQLDLEKGLDMLVYPDETAPYYMGEIISVWNMPSIEREVNFY